VQDIIINMRNCVRAGCVHQIKPEQRQRASQIERERERERERESGREKVVFIIDAVWCYVDQREMLMSDIKNKKK
jgi:hypothetical protein